MVVVVGVGVGVVVVVVVAVVVVAVGVVHTLHMPKPVITFVLKVLRNGHTSHNVRCTSEKMRFWTSLDVRDVWMAHCSG